MATPRTRSTRRGASRPASHTVRRTTTLENSLATAAWSLQMRACRRPSFGTRTSLGPLTGRSVRWTAGCSRPDWKAGAFASRGWDTTAHGLGSDCASSRRSRKQLPAATVMRTDADAKLPLLFWRKILLTPNNREFTSAHVRAVCGCSVGNRPPGGSNCAFCHCSSSLNCYPSIPSLLCAIPSTAIE